MVLNPSGVAITGSWDSDVVHLNYKRVTKLPCSGIVLESSATVGNSPVHETRAISSLDPK